MGRCHPINSLTKEIAQATTQGVVTGGVSVMALVLAMAEAIALSGILRQWRASALAMVMVIATVAAVVLAMAMARAVVMVNKGGANGNYARG